jgi:hypothetical protein
MTEFRKPKLRAWIVCLLGLLAVWVMPVLAADDLVDLKTLFVEAEDEVRLSTVPHMPKQYSAAPPIFWIDNQRLIYSVRELGEWKAQKDERARIVIVNVDGGTVEEAPYRGRLVCLGPDGDMLVEDYPDPNPDYLLPGDSKEERRVYLKGRLGGPLSRYKPQKDSGILNPLTCEYYNNRAHKFGDGFMVGKLRPGDGEIYLKPPYSSSDNNRYMVGSDGEVLWSRERDPCTVGGGGYLPWIDRYFSGVAWQRLEPGCIHANEDSWLYSKSGVDAKPLPAMIQELRRRERSSGANGSTYWARRGLYVFVQYSRGLGVDGLYRQDEDSGQLKRILKKPWGLRLLSPNGCRNLVMTQPPTLLELCKGD